VLAGPFALLHAQTPAPAPAAASATPNDYTQTHAWLCRPGGHDACAVDLTTTVVAADGTLTREPWSARPDAAIDCFYVYPTVSTDQGEYSDMTPDPAERNVIAQQFARFASVCRPFAPLYRQVTLVGLRPRLSGPTIDLGRGPEYNDVRDAWRDYLKRDNGGRGVVLIGHSQGAFILIELLRQEIEGTPVQKQIVSAILMGTTVSAPKGTRTGGTFKMLAPCASASDTGCLITFSTYRSTVPPPANARFGHATEPDQVALCTNPATFNERSGELHAYLSAAGGTITTPQKQAPWAAGKTIETPWVSVPGLLTARCASNDHASYLEVTVNGSPADPRADDIAGDIGPPGKPLADWGLHLVDVNLAMGNLLAIVGQQASAWASRRP
jgi:pimeloyl-ACP methyl ester carboxylesterase